MDIHQETRAAAAQRRIIVMPEETQVNPDINAEAAFSESEQEKIHLHDLSCSHKHTCVEKKSQNFKLPKLNFLSNVTIKWTGNNKEICKISIIILQLLLIFLLLNKLAYVHENKCYPHKNSTSVKLETNSSSVFRSGIILNTINATEQQTSNPLKQISETLFPTKDCQHVVASSAGEYQEKMKNISNQTHICLTIHFGEDHHWNLENISIKPESVREIIFVGCTELVNLSAILDKFKNAYKITFGQTNSKFCDKNRKHGVHRDSQKDYGTKIYLLNLTEIIIENVNCSHIFEFLSKTFYMNAVNSLKINNIVIDHRNAVGIRLLLKQFKYSLEILHFYDVIWKEVLFDSYAYAVPNLSELQIDFLSPPDTHIEFLGGFKAAEHLIKIISMQGYLPYDQFESIFDFKMVKYLMLGLEVPANVTSLDNLFPINILPELEYMELFLKFTNISKCYLLLDYDIGRSYDTILNSNCDDDY